jgi:hypothetical protein
MTAMAARASNVSAQGRECPRITIETDISAIARKWLLPSVQLRHHRRKPLPAAHRVGVVGAQADLVYGQGALVQGTGGVEVALGVQDPIAPRPATPLRPPHAATWPMRWLDSPANVCSSSRMDMCVLVSVGS